MLANASGIYEKIRALRPLFLKVIRLYDDLKHEWKWAEFWQTVYKKANQFLKDIEKQCASVELKVKEENYIKIFKKNLKKIKKMCEDTSITYYSLLPDNMPIDVRTYCIQFISQATIVN
tara:strand:+ start:12 stop:368 length:357 start_codon:yes stop_codon:yes gene_type:complete